MTVNEKLNAMRECEEFAQALDTTATPQELQTLLARHGVELTLEEIKELAVKACAGAQDELSEEDLENVAGGFIGSIAIFVVDQVAKWFVKKGLDKLFG